MTFELTTSRVAAASVGAVAMVGALAIIATDPEGVLRAASYGLTMFAGMLFGAALVMALQPTPDGTKQGPEAARIEKQP